MGAEPQARSSSFAFFFSSVFASLVEASALQAPPRGGVQLRQGAFLPFVLPFFPLAWQDRARVKLAVKARSSSFGCRPFFFSFQDEKLTAAETRTSIAEARVGPAAFFSLFFPVPSGHLGVPSGHLGVPSGRSAERALR